LLYLHNVVIFATNLINKIMGRGDKRSKRGKISSGTFGKYRSAKDNKNNSEESAIKIAKRKEA